MTNMADITKAKQLIRSGKISATVRTAIYYVEPAHTYSPYGWRMYAEWASYGRVESNSGTYYRFDQEGDLLLDMLQAAPVNLWRSENNPQEAAKSLAALWPMFLIGIGGIIVFAAIIMFVL